MPPQALLPLDCLRPGEWADVAEVCGEPEWVGRLAELGLRSGCRLQMVQDGTTCLLNINGCRLCIRPETSSHILVHPVVG